MIKKLFRRLLANIRYNQKIVCEESASRGFWDYHDYPDSIEGEPLYFTLLTCKHCGKEFYC